MNRYPRPRRGDFGHSWLDYPNLDPDAPKNQKRLTPGWYPDSTDDVGIKEYGKEYPGTIVQHGPVGPESPGDTELRYRACPETVKQLQASVDRHSRDMYSADNVDARNCTGWACERVKDAGLPTPLMNDPEKVRGHIRIDPSYPGLHPGTPRVPPKNAEVVPTRPN